MWTESDCAVPLLRTPNLPMHRRYVGSGEHAIGVVVVVVVVVVAVVVVVVVVVIVVVVVVVVVVGVAAAAVVTLARRNTLARGHASSTKLFEDTIYGCCNASKIYTQETCRTACKTTALAGKYPPTSVRRVLRKRA